MKTSGPNNKCANLPQPSGELLTVQLYIEDCELVVHDMCKRVTSFKQNFDDTWKVNIEDGVGIMLGRVFEFKDERGEGYCINCAENQLVKCKRMIAIYVTQSQLNNFRERRTELKIAKNRLELMNKVVEAL